MAPDGPIIVFFGQSSVIAWNQASGIGLELGLELGNEGAERGLCGFAHRVSSRGFGF